MQSIKNIFKRNHNVIPVRSKFRIFSESVRYLADLEQFASNLYNFTSGLSKYIECLENLAYAKKDAKSLSFGVIFKNPLNIHKVLVL